MNNLNSVLLEGELTTDPALVHDSKGAAVTTFDIVTRRFYKEGEEMKKECTTFKIRIRGHQAEACKKHLEIGRGVRTVGRLSRDAEGVYISAEHVEFKPVFKEE